MPRRILIVDDNAINRQMLINTLCTDYDIIEAEDGKAALALIHKNYKSLSAVLLDIMMPEMDGYAVLRHVRENALLAQIPIIMVTGSEDEESRVKALSIGANDFIQKPFNPDIVRHCLKNNIALRETASILNAIQRDKLTGLYNREAFFEKADIMIRDKEPGYYILSSFDIDNFKLINDQYGAAEGDRLLKEIGNTLKRNMERINGIATRISADNFAAIFPDTMKHTGILHNAQNRKLMTLARRSLVFSVGRYVITDTSLPASAIYDRAYIAKQSVKGRYDKHLAYFDDAMLEKLVRDQQIVSDMEAALALKQFEIWFQPQYNHGTGALIGAEALVRWRHPEKGIIPPGEFIPLFEQNGFIYELDKFVWAEACRCIRGWMDRGLDPLPISVNISRYDIFRADLIDTIMGLVKEYCVPIDLLRLEVTESAFAQSTDRIVDIVKALIELGFTIEIDDFGSGYSSLNTLKSVPAQVVKLDMRFLEDNENGQRGGNILESVVRMAKWLGMSIIAEGVETVEQGDFLKSIGCSCVQGYLYARPMPVKDYESYLVGSPREGSVKVLETAEHLNNDTFWNPSSLDSLVFNSFVGAACVFEHHNGNIELLRATDKYAKMLGGDSMTVEELLKLDLRKHLEPETTAETLARVEEVARGKGETKGEFLFIDLPNCPHETFIRSTIRVIASADDRYLAYCISENITAQRMAERMERIVSEQLSAVLGSINCGITAATIADKKMDIIFANDQYYALLGYTREQYEKEIGADAMLTICHEDREYVNGIIARVGKKGDSASMEYRALRRDGNTVWLRSYLSVTNFAGVDMPVQLCTFTDISAEKHTAQDLLDNLPFGAGICVLAHGDAYMTYLNKRYFSYFTHDIGSRRTPSIFSVIHPDDIPSLKEAMIPASETGGEGSCIVRIIDGPGKYIPFRLFGLAMETNSDEKLIYVTFVPISHEEMSFSEMLPVALEKMMEASNDLSFVKDRNLIYISCTRAFAQAAGYENEKDIIGKTDFDLCDHEHAEQYAAEDKRLMATGESVIDMVRQLPVQGGKARYARTSKYPLTNSRGEVIGIYGTGRDITRTREAEDRYKFLINNIPGGVAIYEGKWDTIKSINLTYFSDGFCRLFGYTREEYWASGASDPTGLMAREYVPGLVKQIEALLRDGTPIDYVYRAYGKDSVPLWIHIKAVQGEKHGENPIVYAMFFDVTEHQDALERLRVSEEENRLAIQHSKNVVCRYDIATRSLSISSAVNPVFEMGQVAKDVPMGQVVSGRISQETQAAYIAFYESIIRGEKSALATYQRKATIGWRWIEAHASTIFSSEGVPVSAVISFTDVTETFEKDVAYKKWMQSLHNKTAESYSLFRCNVSRKTVLDEVEGSLLDIPVLPGAPGFDGLAEKYAAKYVCDEDRQRITELLNAAALMDRYYRGERIITMEFRETSEGGEYRWLRLTVDLVEYPHSSDVEAYILFEDINDAKQAELITMERAETDPLTGILNRTAFAERVNGHLLASGPSSRHALLMMDIDGFKLVNDVFGHGAGDQTLIDIAAAIKTALRREDLVCRLGGDEFVVFLSDIPDEKIAAAKAKKICELTRKVFSAEVRISASVGIAIYPQDGNSFEELYKQADETLYRVKDSGRDGFAFHRDDAIKTDGTVPMKGTAKKTAKGEKKEKRRMLIVDDSRIDYEMLSNLFKDDFITENASDGNTALVRLRHYGTAVSVVLLDLMMPGMDGFAVMDLMQQNRELSTIPVVVVSGADDRETCLRAIRSGASDYVTKPVDTDVLRIRVMSAVSKAENERLRAKNSFLETQNEEIERYKSVMESLGLAAAELDISTGSFRYGPSVARCILGNFDDRALWDILVSDGAADKTAAENISRLAQGLISSTKHNKSAIYAELATPQGEKHRFRIAAYKQTDDNDAPQKILFTFFDEYHDDPDEETE